MFARLEFVLEVLQLVAWSLDALCSRESEEDEVEEQLDLKRVVEHKPLWEDSHQRLL